MSPRKPVRSVRMSSEPRRSRTVPRRFWLPWIVFVVAAPTWAVDIQPFFDPNNASETYLDPNNVDRTLDLIPIVEAAAAHWEDIIEDNHTLTLSYWWVATGAPQISEAVVQNGRVTWAIMIIPVDINWFIDPTPDADEEFDMAPKLYRNTHPAEQAEAFSGAPPEVFEVGYNGPETSGIPIDLLSVVTHEIGHALGLIGSVSGDDCDVDHYYDIDPDFVGGAVMGLKAFENDGDFDCGHLALGGIQECLGDPNCESYQALLWTGPLPDRRSRPGSADILALASASNWTQIDLPRKFSLGTGLWNTPGTWLGDWVPDAGDDVYIVNTPLTTISLSAGAGAARNLTISDGNFLQITGVDTLSVSDTVTITDNSEFAINAFLGELDAATVQVDSDGELAVNLSLATIGNLANQGIVSGEGAIDVFELDNTGTIQGGGGTFNFTTTNVGPAFDLDGFFDSASALVDASNGNIDFVGDWTDGFGGTIIVGSGRSLSFNDELTIGGPVQLNGGGFEALIDGPVSIAFGADVDVDNDGRFGSTVEFNSGAEVHVNDPNDRLILSGQTTYVGGTYTGLGTIKQESFAQVLANTTIDVATLDWDGNGNSTTSIWPDVTFTINSTKIEAGGFADGFDGTLNVIGGQAAVNTSTTWWLDGTANLIGGTSPATISGSDMDINGTVAVQNAGRLEAEVNIYGSISTFDPNSVATLASGSVNHILGGSITGVGTFHVAANTSLHGFGTIDSDIDIEGTVRADDGTLTVNGNFVGLGTVGTASAAGTLDVTHDWNTLTGLLDLIDGRVTGGDIFNSGTTAGFGVLGITLFTNRGLVAPGNWEVIPGSETGILTFEGSYDQASSGLLEIGIAGLVAGDNHDQLNIRNNAGLAGTLDVALLNGYVPQCGDSFTIMTYGSFTGDFDTYNGLVINNDLQFVPDLTPTALILTVGLIGDLNGDGEIGIADLAQLLSNYGMTSGATYEMGDIEPLGGDSDVDLADLAALLAAYGTTCP